MSRAAPGGRWRVALRAKVSRHADGTTSHGVDLVVANAGKAHPIGEVRQRHTPEIAAADALALAARRGWEVVADLDATGRLDS